MFQELERCIAAVASSLVWVWPPLPLRLRQPVRDHPQSLHIVPIAEVAAVNRHVLGFGGGSAEAALPRHYAVGLAVHAGGGNPQRLLPRDAGCLGHDVTRRRI